MFPNLSDSPQDVSIKRAEKDIEKLQEGLDRIETKLDALLLLGQYVKTHEALLNGDVRTLGIRIRLDRIEQAAKRQQRHLQILAGFMVALLVELFHKLIGKL